MMITAAPTEMMMKKTNQIEHMAQEAAAAGARAHVAARAGAGVSPRPQEAVAVGEEEHEALRPSQKATS